MRVSDPAPPAPAPEPAEPAQIRAEAPREFSPLGAPRVGALRAPAAYGAPAPPAWADRPQLDYSRAYPPAPPGYAARDGYAAPGAYPPPHGAPGGGPEGDPRATAYFDRMHAARAPPGEEDGDDDDEDDDDDDTASQASTKDSKKRAARAALASKEKAQRLAREKNVLMQLMLAAPESALDTLMQAPAVQAAVQEFVNGRLDVDKLERDLIVIDCVSRVRGQHAASRALDDQAPKIADGIWKAAGWGAEAAGVVPRGAWDLARSEWGAETENTAKVQRDWVRTLLASTGASGTGNGTAMFVQQMLALVTPVAAIAMTARSMAPPAVPAPAAGYGYAPPPAQSYALPPAQSYAPPPAQSYAPPPAQSYAPPPAQASIPATAEGVSLEPARSTSQTASVLDAPPTTGARPPTPEPPPITMSFAPASLASGAPAAPAGDVLGGGLDL